MRREVEDQRRLRLAGVEVAAERAPPDLLELRRAEVEVVELEDRNAAPLHVLPYEHLHWRLVRAVADAENDLAEAVLDDRVAKVLEQAQEGLDPYREQAREALVRPGKAPPDRRGDDHVVAPRGRGLRGRDRAADVDVGRQVRPVLLDCADGQEDDVAALGGLAELCGGQLAPQARAPVPAHRSRPPATCDRPRFSIPLSATTIEPVIILEDSFLARNRYTPP